MANFLDYKSRYISVLLVSLGEWSAAETRHVVMNRGPIKSKFPPGQEYATSDRYIRRRRRRQRKSRVVAFNGRNPYSGCHGDRVETVSRGREPSAIRDPAKWTVPGTYGYCKVKLVYAHTILPEAPFKPLSTIHDYRLNVRLKKRFQSWTLTREVNSSEKRN